MSHQETNHHRNYTWDRTFTELFMRCLERYQSGDSDYSRYYNEQDQAFLKSIGYKPREFFDFVEDYGDGGEPSVTAAVMIAGVRRNYLAVVQHGKPSDQRITPNDLPSKSEELDGIRWLPRIIVKARAKLRGELHPDIMYSCGGDRGFLREHDIHPADFLRAVWASDGDDAGILEFVRSHRNGNGSSSR